MNRSIEGHNISVTETESKAERNEELKVNQIATELGIDLITLEKSGGEEFAKAYLTVFKEYVRRLKREPLKDQKEAVRWWVKETRMGANVVILLGRAGYSSKKDTKLIDGTVIESLDLGWSDRYEQQLVKRAFKIKELRLL